MSLQFKGLSGSESEVAQPCAALCDTMGCNLPGFSVHGIFSGKSTGVGCHFHLQGIFLNQGSNPGPSEDPHCRLPSEPPWKNLLQKHNLKASILWQLSLLYGPALTSIRDFWEDHSLDYMDLCLQSDVFAF